MSIINAFLSKKKGDFWQVPEDERINQNFPLLKIGFHNPFCISHTKRDSYLNLYEDSLQFYSLIVHEKDGETIEEGILNKLVEAQKVLNGKNHYRD